MALNETICVLGSEPSDIEALNLGKWVGSLIAIGLLLVAVVGFVIRGLFIYYLTYEAQKDRTINTLIYDEQVKYLQCTEYSVSYQNNPFHISGNPNVNNVCGFHHDSSSNCHPNSNG